MYTYRITFALRHRYLGWIEDQSFRTTDDAVELHRSAFRIREHAGEVRNVRIEAIA